MKVDIYKVDLSKSNSSLSLDLLDGDEKERAARFVTEALRQKYVTSHAFLRQVLSTYLKVEPESIHYQYNAHGKPSVENNPVYFNLSHSGDLAMVAICLEAPVGIDVEKPKQLDDFASIAVRFFSAEEVGALMAKPQAEQLNAFYTLWTRKEAYLKMLGLGVSFGLSRFTVSLEDESFNCLIASEVESDDGQQCWLGSIKADKNYAAAIAVPKKSPLFIDYCDI